jgi:hypothetical protein
VAGDEHCRAVARRVFRGRCCGEGGGLLGGLGAIAAVHCGHVLNDGRRCGEGRQAWNERYTSVTKGRLQTSLFSEKTSFGAKLVKHNRNHILPTSNFPNTRISEGGVAGVVPTRRVMFRGFTVKFETTFVKHNPKLVHKCGFRFSGRSLEHAEQKPRNLESGPQNLDFRGQVEELTLFPGVTPKSEVAIVSPLSILFHQCGLRFW